jgi:hypothetical protein
MALEVQIGEIRTGTYGWTMTGGIQVPYFEQFGVEMPPEEPLVWTLDPDQGTATTHNGYTVKLKPFMGVMGMPPDKPGNHPTFPPRFCGGNIDCRALVSGSTLYLPIPVDGGLFSVGDGHGAQGDGEISWTAIECPMERVDLTFNLRDDLPISTPIANTPEGWITLGFGMSVDQALVPAVNAMLDLMVREYGRRCPCCAAIWSGESGCKYQRVNAETDKRYISLAPSNGLPPQASVGGSKPLSISTERLGDALSPVQTMLQCCYNTGIVSDGHSTEANDRRRI